jgi:hypothetical protein
MKYPHPLPIGKDEQTRRSRGITYNCITKIQVSKHAIAYLYSLPKHEPIRRK